MMAVFAHDPDAVLDYSLDWSPWLGADTITDSSWTVPTGITEDTSSYTTTTTTIIVSGGTAGNKYTLTNHVTTAAGYEDDRSITLHVEER